MRLLLLVWALWGIAFASVPPELASALKAFRSDPPRGWSFTQTTTADGKSTVERFDAALPAFSGWSLVQKDGRAPTDEERKDYAEARSRRSRTGTAPSLTEQFVLEAGEVVADTADRLTFRCPLRPGESRDQTALHLRATLVVHKPSRTIESVELTNAESFAPTFGVKIHTMKTLMTYSPPSGEQPSLPQKVETHLRGRAFVFKSLDADMSVTYSDYRKAGR